MSIQLQAVTTDSIVTVTYTNTPLLQYDKLAWLANDQSQWLIDQVANTSRALNIPNQRT